MSRAKPLAEQAVQLLADRVAREQNVPRALLLAVARHESAGFYPDAHRGEPHLGDSSHGLMQLLLSTARGLGYGGAAGAWDEVHRKGSGLYDPYVNLTLGARHLRNLQARTGDLQTTIAAYNAGLGNAKRATVPTRFCEVWKPTAPATGRNIDRDCARIRNVPIGEFYNQPYVTRVMNLLKSYGGSATMPFRYEGTAGSGGESGPAAGQPAGSSPSPSPSLPAPSGGAFVIRTVPLVVLAALAAIAYLLRGGR